jgi:pyruvate dehydrogenase E2 component (dihydrolipoamide acetyltransferase)
MAKEFFIPKLGQTVEEVTIVKWLIEDGSKVDIGDAILEVETDKAIFPVEADSKGYLHRGPYKEGDIVPVLTVVAVIGKQDETFESAMQSSKQPEQPISQPPVIQQIPQQISSPAAALEKDKIFASPRARKLAKEENVDLRQVVPTGGGGLRIREQDVRAYLAEKPKATPLAQRVAAAEGIDLAQITGSGKDGLITREDVEKARSAAQVSLPSPIAPSQADMVERIPLKGVRAIIADRMGTSVHTTARVTMFMDVDATEFVKLREHLKLSVSESWGFSPSINDLLIKVVTVALQKFPYMNARLTADSIEILHQINIGLAVDTDRGLLVPVVRDVAHKPLQQVAKEMRMLIERAKEGRSLPDDLTGGTFTITNLGMYDVEGFTPVINLPEAAILGVGSIIPKPVVRNDQIVIRKMCTLSLVFDHRIVDGAPAARFMQFIKQLVEDPYLLILG